MENEQKSTLSPWIIVVSVLIIFVAVLCWMCWSLGKQQVTEVYAPTVNDLQIENEALRSEVASLQNQLELSGHVSAETAMEILLDRYPANKDLVSMEYPFSDCARFTYSQKISDWEIPFTEKAFTMKWNGVITAGIDMDGVSIHTNKAGNKLIVTIPNAKVISFRIDEESIELLNEQNNLLNLISLEDLFQLDVEIEDTMKKRALSNDLLETAQDNARIMITDVLRSNPAIGSHYMIEFKLQ